jgi:hypothetical protein
MDDPDVIDLTGPEELDQLDLRRADNGRKVEEWLMPEGSSRGTSELDQFKGSVDACERALQAPSIQVPQFPIPDMPDLAASIANNKRAERDALSAIIERHTAPVRHAVDGLKAAHEDAATRMFWLTVAIVVLTILLVVFGGISTYLLLR